MAENLKTSQGNTFYDAVRKNKRDEVVFMLKNRILDEIEGDKTEIYRNLVFLRDKRVMKFLSAEIKTFPVEILETAGANENDLEFISFVLSKYINKFDLADENVAERIFEVCCLCGNKKQTAYMIRKKLGLGKLPCIVSNAPELIELIDIISDRLLTDELIVEMYLSAARASDPEERVYKLWKFGLDPRTRNAAGKTAYNIAFEEAKNTKYENNKSGVNRRQTNNYVARVLRKILEEDKPKKRLKKAARLAIIIAVCVIVACGAAYFITYMAAKKAAEASAEEAYETIAEEDLYEIDETYEYDDTYEYDETDIYEAGDDTVNSSVETDADTEVVTGSDSGVTDEVIDEVINP